MQDKMLMEGLLWDTKVLSDLCLHGSIESATKEVHETFFGALKDILGMQHDIYKLMSDEGWYRADVVSQSKLDEAIQKFRKLVEKED